MDEPQEVFVNNVANAVVDLGHRFMNMMNSIGWAEAVNAHTNINYSSPSLTARDVFDELLFAGNRIRALADTDVDVKLNEFLGVIEIRSRQLLFDNLANSPGMMMLAALEVANSIARHVPWPSKPISVNWEDVRDEKHLLPKDLARRLRFVASHLDALEPRSIEIDRKIKDIEDAHAAAEQLPVDMAELAAKRDEVRRYAEEATRMAATAETAIAAITETRDKAAALLIDGHQHLAAIRLEADLALKKAERALSGATSVGLAGAFARRRGSLAWATFLWTVGLAAALLAAWWIGSERVAALKTVLVDGKSASIIWANVFLTVLGLGGPIWFAWLSTKQIGTTFRLSEDYAFKATVSQAYEGYRSEAVQIDEALKIRLFSTALDRIEEAPIRLVDPTHHSSPVQEFVSMPAIKKQLDSFPDISGEVISFIKAKLTTAGTATAAVAGATAAAVVSKVAPGKDGDSKEVATAD